MCIAIKYHNHVHTWEMLACNKSTKRATNKICCHYYALHLGLDTHISMFVMHSKLSYSFYYNHIYGWIIELAFDPFSVSHQQNIISLFLVEIPKGFTTNDLFRLVYSCRNFTINQTTQKVIIFLFFFFAEISKLTNLVSLMW